MATITQFKLKTLTHYMEIVQNLQHKSLHSLWFRGVTNSKFGLVPTLYRHPTINLQTDLRNLENQLMTRFRQRSIPYRTRDLTDDWEVLFFMQHYAVPTRLLDWTENPFIGLHFALMHASARSLGIKKRTFTESVVWVLNPNIWNETSLNDITYKGGPLSTTDESMKGFAPSSTTLKAHPVALYGAYNSPRIVAQQGAFTIFGVGQTPMEKLVANGVFPTQALTKIVIDPDRVQAIRKSLLNQGVTEAVVFPDLEGLALETKRHFGFEG